MSESYKDLIVWQKSMILSERIYQFSRSLPSDESKNLISQIKRCSVSIFSNIAEGYSRGSTNHYRQFFKITFASAAELESQLELIGRVKLSTNSELYTEINNILLEVLKMLSTMISNTSKKKDTEKQGG